MARVFPLYGKSILDHFGLSEESLLGAGSEARVYSLDDQRILKIHRAGTPRKKIEKQKIFYDGLKNGVFLLRHPEIIEFGEKGGNFYTIEKKIPGTNMKILLKTLQGDRRQALLKSYLEAASALSPLYGHADFYGEILAEEPVREKNWQRFLVRRIEKTLKVSAACLLADIPDLNSTARKWHAAVGEMPLLEKPGLVHGDFYPDNLMADPATGCVTAIIDFSTMALAGDWRMDPVAALSFLSVGRDDQQFVESIFQTAYPEITPGIFRLYKTYYAFYFSPAKQDDPDMYRWCVESIREFGET